MAEAGHEVALIAPIKEDNSCDQVQIHDFPVFPHPFLRMLIAPWIMLVRAFRAKAVIYHFHDPELVPAGIVLRLLTRRPVIYDVHEDVAASIKVRSYIPAFLRGFLAWSYRLMEKMACRFFTIVIAEKYYADFLPKGIPILNYPRLSLELGAGSLELGAEGLELGARSGEPGAWSAERGAGSPGGRSSRPDCCHWLFYSGSVTKVRGALNHARMAGLVDDVGVYSAGKCSPALAKEMQDLANGGGLVIEGMGTPVPRQRLDELASGYTWLAGLAVFPDSEHYRRKELTKFFEYMQAGIPILCSNMPAWKEFVEGQGIGLAVDPDDPAAQRAAIQYLIDHPEEREAMGRRGRDLVHTRFNWETQADKLVALYEHLLDSASRV